MRLSDKTKKNLANVFTIIAVVLMVFAGTLVVREKRKSYDNRDTQTEQADSHAESTELYRTEDEKNQEYIADREKNASTEQEKNSEQSTSQEQERNSEQSTSQEQEKNSEQSTSQEQEKNSEQSTSQEQEKNSEQNTSTEQKQDAIQTCTISIQCLSILDNMDKLASGKEEFVPTDGYILFANVEYTEGETVFDVLKRACSSYGIQIEYSYTPIYGTYYIEGINQLYEFDCGSTSGWMYSVNGVSPNVGCSSYTVMQGDSIVFYYTCGY